MATTRQSSGSARRKAAPARSRSTSASRKPAPAAAPTTAQPGTVSKLAKPVLAGGAAVAAVVGGAILGAKAMPRKRRFPASIGNPLDGLDMKKARKQIGRGAKQFGELTRELRKAGEQAERIGDALL